MPDLDNIRSGMQRNPFVLTTTKWEQEGKGIVLWCNPSEVSWQIPIRGEIQKTHGGLVYHTWKTKQKELGGRDTYYDNPILGFTFQTGNMMMFFEKNVSSTNSHPDANSVGINIADGQKNLYAFLEMLNQDKTIPFLDTTGNQKGITNFDKVKYYSKTFPGMLLTGFWSPEGIQFSETGEDPWGLTWTAQFQVVSTTPNFYGAVELQNHFSQIGYRKDQVSLSNPY